MAIKFFKSDLNKLPQYIELYKRCFKKYPEKKILFILRGFIEKIHLEVL